MGLLPGSQLGRYEILSLAGAGGMGEVYRARDTRLDRTVAIKILPPHMAGDERSRQRFEREARAVSSLNHPNICALYDVGRHEDVDFLVLEYLEGETLAERLARGSLPVPQLLHDAAAIADALDKAHRHGIVHRDLKPANIMLTKTGPKLLDFGVARLHESAASAGDARLSELSTETKKESLTVEGAVPGTLPYMAPEQVEGKEADSRTDLFALGAIIFEMATQRRAFEGATRAGLTAAILERDPPPVSTLQPNIPSALDRVVKRCLAKDPEERWQTARDLAFELKWIADGGSQPDGNTIQTRGGMTRKRIGWIAAIALLGLAVAWLVLGSLTSRQRSPGATRLSLLPPSPESSIPDLAISPDGRTLAMIVWNPSGTQLWVRPLDSLAARALPGTEGASGRPFWSPDGRFLGYIASGKLMKIALGGGAPQAVCAVPLGTSASWGRDGTILFGSASGGLQRVSAAGGEPAPIDPPSPPEDKAASLLCPSFLPDGRHFLYFRREEERSGVMVGSLDSNVRTRLLDGQSAAIYAPPGYLLLVRDGTLMAQPFDAKRLRLSGEAVPVAEQVAYADFGRFLISVSATGVLAYISEKRDSRLVWYDRSGRELAQVGEPGDYLHVDLSPDGTRAAVERGDPLGEGGEHDVSLIDLSLGTTSRFTFDAGYEGYPIWSPDGSQVAYIEHRGGKYGIYRKPANGTGKEELLLSTPRFAYPSSFSPDGRSLVFEGPGEQGPPDLWILALDSTRTAKPFETTPTWENSGMVSPDGRWIAYNIRGDLYVQSFPTPGGKWQVASDGGYPRWRRDGKELFYGNMKGELVAVTVNAGAAFRTGAPRKLFRAPSVRLYKNRFPYAVTPDGQRFLINRLDTASTPVTVVLDWTAGLKQ